jgi:hypothetical protein
VGYLAFRGETRIHKVFWLEILVERVYCEDLGVAWRIILKSILNKSSSEDVKCIVPAGDSVHW